MSSHQKHKLYILGTGTSTGVPMVGCDCRVCTSPEQKDKRLRSSLLIETKLQKKILIDTTPDLRTQLLREKVAYIDAVLITHDHADHVHGMDDLRPFCFLKKGLKIPIYTNAVTATALNKRFDYIFDPNFRLQQKRRGGGLPELELIKIDESQQVTLALEPFEFFTLPHGDGVTLGFIHSKFAYLPDCHDIPEDVVMKLRTKNLDLLIIDCLKPGTHSTHLTIDRSFEFISRILPKEAGLIHMAHNLTHDELSKMATEAFLFPVYPLYDGQVLEYE